MNAKKEKIFFYVAVGGFISALLAHLLSLLGVNLQDVFPPIFILHLIIFVVWIPAVLKLNNIKKEYKIKYGEYPKITPLNLRKFIPHTPKILLMLPVFFLIYGAFSFFLFQITVEGGGPSIIDAKYVLSNHGDVIREITFAEYQKFQAAEIRFFSSLWLVFYSAASLMLYPKKTDF